jgi:hypothetical protein
MSFDPMERRSESGTNSPGSAQRTMQMYSPTASVTSGESTSRWIKQHKPRSDQYKPNHLVSGHYFFLVPGEYVVHENMRQANVDGTAWIMPWDHKFEDNVGTYALYVLLSQTQPEVAPFS